MWFKNMEFGTVYYAVEWIIRLSAIGIVPMRRTPAATRSWLLLIFFLPVPGALLFLAIGSPRFPAWRIKRFQRLAPFYQDIRARLETAAPPDGSAANPAASLAQTLGHLPAVPGNAIELIDDYDAVIDRLVADIDGARRHVRILVYIFADDATGQKIVAALRRAVARGVPCQVMIDPVGSHHWLHDTMRLLRDAGVDAREALPFRLLHGRITRRDMRNHRKLFVIDGEIGFAGSQNIVAKDFKPGVTNRELVARVTGPVVAEMEAIIRADWYLETGLMPDTPVAIPARTGEASAQLLPSGAEYHLEGFETLLVWQIHQARERVTIVTPYFIPDEDVLSAMRTAVARGVTVNLVLSKVVDQRLVNLAQCSYYDDLLSAGIGIHLFRDTLLHAKNVSIDGRFAVVGSSNVDLRSFTLNEEVSLLLFDPASVECVEKIQRDYLQASDAIQQNAWRQRAAPRKLAENIARLVSSLL
jgi:cardiolipin synthase